MSTDSYLHLLPPAVADAIRRTLSPRRRAFAIACARVAVDHCAYAVLGLDAAAKATLAELRESTLAAIDGAETGGVDARLAGHEDRLWQQLCALRRDDAEVRYGDFVRLATQRHTIRALRATLLGDGISAAARAAFETVCATRDEERIVSMARDTMPPAG